MKQKIYALTTYLLASTILAIAELLLLPTFGLEWKTVTAIAAGTVLLGLIYIYFSSLDFAKHKFGRKRAILPVHQSTVFERAVKTIFPDKEKQVAHPALAGNLYYVVTFTNGSIYEYPRNEFWADLREMWELQKSIESGANLEKRYKSPTSEDYWMENRHPKFGKNRYRAFIYLLESSQAIQMDGQNRWLKNVPQRIIDAVDATHTIYRMQL